jgi:group I intron endonuclease
MQDTDNILKGCFGVHALKWVFANGEHGNETYIGSTVQKFRDRRLQHLWVMKRGVHNNMRLQGMYRKYGEPIFEIIEICSNKKSLHEREQHYIDKYGIDNLLNMGPALPAAMLGRKHTAETRAKMSAALKGRVVSDETREKLSIARVGYVTSEDTKKKLSKANKGKKLSKEHKEKISIASMGKIIDEEQRKKISATLTGVLHTDEYKANMSVATMGHTVSDETRAHLSAALKGRVFTDEWIANMSAAQKLRFARKKLELEMSNITSE